TTGGTKVEFNRGYYFQFDPNLDPVAEINLNFRGGVARDDAWIRPVLAMETFRDAGCPASVAFPMRIQQNGMYGGVRIFIEQPDERYLERQGFYGDGSLYKTPNADDGYIADAEWFEKKNRDEEGTADLQALLDAIHQDDRDAVARYLLDNFDIPRFLDYQAATVLTESLDAPQKNYYLYRDTHDADNPNGSNEWMFLPWDQHLSFGKNWAIPDYQAVDPQAHPFFADSDHPKIDGPHAWNYLIDALLDVPMIKEMYLRRLRTVMDKLLQPNGTPYASLYYENRLDQLYNQLMGDPDFVAENGDLQWAFDEIKNEYLPRKRDHFYVDHSENTSYPDYAGIPTAQAAHPAIRFGAYDYNPASGNQDEEYLELKNPNSYAVDISNWRLDGGVEFEFEPGTVIPANSSIYVSPNAAAFRSRTTGPRGGQGLLVMGPYQGHLSAWGEMVRLIDDGGTPVALMSYGQTPSEAQKFLRITEVMYDPAAQTGSSVPDNEQFEFVELQNISDESLNLSGIRFTQGIGFIFGNIALGPKQYIVVVKNRAAFESRYGVGKVNLAGEYGQSLQSGLNNGGDRIQLVDAAGEEILDFRYEPTWQLSCDELGRSLVIKDAAADPSSWGNSTSWRASALTHGSPGESDPEAALGAPTVNVVHVQPELRSTPVDAVTIVFSEPVTGFGLSDLALKRDGGVNLLTSSQMLTTADNITWVLSGLTELTSISGTYVLTVAGAQTGIVDLAGNPLVAGDEERFVVDRQVPTVVITPVAPDPRLNGVDSITITFSKPVMGFELADLHLTRDGAEVLMNWQQTLTTTDKKTWTLNGLSSLTSPKGMYVITLDPDGSGITDLTGSQPLVGKASDVFTVGQIPPTVQMTPVADTAGPVDSITFTFSAPVTGFDLSDLQLTREGGANVLTSAQTLTSSDGKTWTLGNLAGVSDRLGGYRLLLKASGSGIVDANQTPLASDASEEFVVYGLRANGRLVLRRSTINSDQLNVYISNIQVPDYSVRYGTLPMLEINDGAGDDWVVLDFSRGDMLPAGDVRFTSRAGGRDALVICGNNGGQAIQANGSEVHFGDRVIGAVGVGGIVLEGVNGSVLDLKGTAAVSLAAGGSKVLKLGGLSIADAATFDLADNDLIVTATPETKAAVLTALSNAIKSARGDGSWTGTGLTSSMARANNLTGLAILLNDQDGSPSLSSFAGQPVPENDILVKSTWTGDVDLTGVVDGDDYFLIDAGFISGMDQYRNGDVDLNGVI
ncbi:MAG: lamin tail domain-containing protein, partial [Bacillota bacterium]